MRTRIGIITAASLLVAAATVAPRQADQPGEKEHVSLDCDVCNNYTYNIGEDQAHDFGASGPAPVEEASVEFIEPDGEHYHSARKMASTAESEDGAVRTWEPTISGSPTYTATGSTDFDCDTEVPGQNDGCHSPKRQESCGTYHNVCNNLKVSLSVVQTVYDKRDLGHMAALIRNGGGDIGLNAERQSVQVFGCDRTTIVGNLPLSRGEFSALGILIAAQQ